MKLKLAAVALAAAFSLSAQAQTEIQWWHSMDGALNDWVTDLTKQFNASQTEYKVVPTYKGEYDQSVAAGIAAYRAGNAPDILQAVSYTHLRAHETRHDLVCRLLLE